ncbi:hypothetical protein KY361_04510 [Candidatus Woesearchaeota archaeon]|nr:hypothetical protein [Candidatus Woesearchaeota archaeon]
MKYPDSVITHNRKGDAEVRVLVDKGRYCRYQYTDPKTGRLVEKGKTSIMLETADGKKEHFFLIPVKGGRFLALSLKDAEKARKVWNKGKKKEESLF